MIKKYCGFYIAFALLFLMAPMCLGAWPLTDIPRKGDDRIVRVSNGSAIDSGPTDSNGLCDTEKHPLSDDEQVIPKGQGAPNTICVESGDDHVINSNPQGDDQKVGETITTGPNGICETTATGDDGQAIRVGRGEAKAICIKPGADGILGYQSAPHGMSTTLGELAVSWNRMHTGVDIPGTLDITKCISLAPGRLQYFGNTEPTITGIYVNVTDSTDMFTYLHTIWNLNDGEQPEQLSTVPANIVIGQLMPFSETFTHLHLEERGVSSREKNPLRSILLNPWPKYDTGYPKIVQDVVGPVIKVVKDKLQEQFRLRNPNTPQETPVVTGNADVIARVESRAWDFYTNKPDQNLRLTHDIPILPYEASFSITNANGYSFSRTLYRMDVLPDWDTQLAKSNLIYAPRSEAYKLFWLTLTNCDGSDNLDELANVTESNWPVGEKNEQGEWLVPNGRYTIAVTVKDYAGAEATSSINVEVDHGDFQRPTNTQN